MLHGMTGAALSLCLVRRDALGCNRMLRAKSGSAHPGTCWVGKRWPISSCLPATLPAAAHSSCVQLDQVDFARSLGSSTRLMRGASSNAGYA